MWLADPFTRYYEWSEQIMIASFVYFIYSKLIVIEFNKFANLNTKAVVLFKLLTYATGARSKEINNV